MKSITENKYPQFRWHGRDKMLWNPIHKKTLKNLPEERVRLRVIEFLIHAGWSKNRISTEESIGKMADKELRTDVICYTQDFEPQLLVECKADQINISSETAEQAARYNQKVKAPYMLLTNGIADYWYKIEGERIAEVQKSDLPFLNDIAAKNLDPDFSYWNRRGFAGKRAGDHLKDWFSDTLPGLWHSNEFSIQFLAFGEGPSEVDISHYYAIEKYGEKRKIAVTTTKTAQEENRLIFILNVEGENKGVIEVNLDLLFDDKDGNASLYFSEGIRTFDIVEYTDISNTVDISKIMEQVNDLFLSYVE